MFFLIIILYFLIIITVGAVIINTNSPSKAIAYLLLIILLPIFGIVLYFTVGVNYRKRKLYKKKIEIDKEKYPLFESRYESFSQKLLQQHKEQLNQFYYLACNRSLSLLTCSNNVSLLINGEEKFTKLLQDLKNAKQFIHLEYYIYENDQIGNAIAEILLDKARQGLQVRMIYDDFGSAGLSNKFIKNLKESGVQVVPFFRIRWLLFANRINYRNHRKIVVIDGWAGYIGGINISDKYINNDTKKLFWRDTSVRVEGLATATLQYVFLTDWNFCANENIAFSALLFPYEQYAGNITHRQLMQTVISGPDSDCPSILYAMVQAIHLCKEELLITTPYFIPPPTLIDALKTARLSGVNIKLLVPGISDSKLVNAISNSYYGELLDVGIEIYKYKKGFVHAKTMACDGQVAFVGTTNLDQRSFELNFEIHQVIYDASIAVQLKNAFYADLNDSEKIDKAAWNNRSPMFVFIERIARLISPLI